ncbi:MAG: hypothetical protein K1X57_16625 [Gemmataceae bacterium]|nr:hypothetical protein [Gemmataceae bacterium]
MALTLGQKIVAWAQGQMGKTVGAGECWDLGEQALSNSGAKTSNDLGPVGDDVDYIWGDPIDVKNVQSGDILQIRDHEQTISTTLEYTFKDGTEQEETDEVSLGRPHHTSIINGKLDADGAVATIEQNVDPGGRVVQNKKLYTRDVPAKVTKKVEKKHNPTTGKDEMVTVTKTVTVTVKGTITPYRPKAK